MSDNHAPNPPKQQTYRYFVAFSFTTREGLSAFGNCEVARGVPLASVNGPEGLVGLQEQLKAAGGWVHCCVLGWPTLLPEDKPAILVAGALPNLKANPGVTT